MRATEGASYAHPDHANAFLAATEAAEGPQPGAPDDAPHRSGSRGSDSAHRGRRRPRRETRQRLGHDGDRNREGRRRAKDGRDTQEDVNGQVDACGQRRRRHLDAGKHDRLAIDSLVHANHVEHAAGGHLRRIVNVTPNTSLGTSVFTALGTTAQVTVADAGALPDAVSIVERELHAIDLACSRFRDDSELTALNRSHGREIEASRLLLEALTTAIDAARSTDGAVDPTVGRAMSGLGWDLDFSVVVARGEPRSIEIVPAGGWRSIKIDHERGTVRVARGVEVDLGATAKALAADRSAAAVAAATGTGALVSLGGDIAIAGPAPEGGWPIRVTDDHRGSVAAPGQTIALSGGGLATSSTTVRRWRAGSAERHHIVDPSTGLPAEEVWRTVSVAAASCVDANVASTAAIVRGRDALSWLEDAGLPSRLVTVDGRVIHAANWPEDTL